MITERIHRDRSSEKGGAVVEFAFSTLVWLPLLLGTSIFGINLVKALQVSALSRDAGHMYAYGVDFRTSANQALLTNLASGLDLTSTGSSGMMLSKITLITDTDCAAAANFSCGNNGKYVFTEILLFGNRTLIKTTLGSPPLGMVDGSGVLDVSQALYLNDSRFIANVFPGLLAFPSTTQSGQYAYTSEVFLNSQAFAWSSFSNTGSYARTIF